MTKFLFQKGHSTSEETRRKISYAHQGLRPSEESRRKMSEVHKGHKPSKETRIKLSKALIGNSRAKGNQLSIETRKKMSIAKKGTQVSESTRRKLSEANSGEKSRFWKGGITPINEKIRKSLEYKLWRESVFKRDNWTCVWCGYKSKGTRPADINADHIKPFALFPELRFAIDNGRTLCIPCHKTTDNYGGRCLAQLQLDLERDGRLTHEEVWEEIPLMVEINKTKKELKELNE